MNTLFRLLGVLFILSREQHSVYGHARLIDPPSRASAWRYDFDTPPDYNDNGNNCGGRTRQHIANKGKCGICGDPWDQRRRKHERFGKYATDTIVRHYREGQVIKIGVEITSNHRGHIEFGICPVSRKSREVTQRCLDSNRLYTANGSGPIFEMDNNDGKHEYYLKLPAHLVCEHCVLQWKYIAGNNWGICKDGKGALGCGNQEEFRACADIRIGARRKAVSPRTKSVLEQRRRISSEPVYPYPTQVVMAQRKPPKTSPPAMRTAARQRPSRKPRPRATVSAPSKKAKQHLSCQPSRRMRRLPGIVKWCEQNCANTPSFCPPSHCVCSNNP